MSATRTRIVALAALAASFVCISSEAAQTEVPHAAPSSSEGNTKTEPATMLRNARSLLGDGKLAEAESLLRQALNENQQSAEAHFLLGEVLFREQKPRESLAEFTSGAKWKRPGPVELRVVASDYVLLKDFADADKWFTEVTAETPADPEAWYLLGRTKYDENRFAEAIASFEHVLSLRPRDVKAENNRGLSLQGLGRNEEAEATFQRAIDWESALPGDAQPYMNLGRLLTDQGDAARAVPLLAKAAQLSPHNPKIHEELGRAYLAQGDLPNAQTQLERAIAIAHNASSLHFKLGQVYHRRGLAEMARAQFEICARLDGSHSSVEVPNPFSRPLDAKPPH